MDKVRFCAVAVVFFTSPVFALAQTQSAKDFVIAKHEIVMSIYATKSSGAEQQKARQTKLDAALDGFVNYEELGKRSLGKHWASKNPAQRKVFVELLTRLIKNSYQRNLERTMSFKIAYDGEEKLSDGTLVKTTAKPTKNRRAEAVRIDYALMSQADGSWRVFDIVTDGVSLVKNYRFQFEKIIKKSGWDELIKKMRDRVDKEQGDLA